MSDSILLVRDVLDQPIVGPDEHPCGTVDGIVLALADDGTLRVAAIEEGAATLARRISKTLGRMLERFPVVRIPFTQVWGVGTRVLIAGGIDRDRLVAAESWAREYVIAHIPGA